MEEKIENKLEQYKSTLIIVEISLLIVAFLMKTPVSRDIVLIFAGLCFTSALLFMINNTLLKVISWIAASLFFMFVSRAFIFALQLLAHEGIAQLPDIFVKMLPFLVFSIGMAIILGLGLVAVFKKSKKVLNYLNVMNPILFLFSLYAIIHAFIDKNEDVSKLILFILALLLGLVLGLYNRLKMKRTGVISRSFYLLTLFETIVYFDIAFFHLFILNTLI